MPNCLVCGAEKVREAMHIIVLTDEEKAALANPVDECLYCKPCWKVLSNPATAPSLISGIARHQLMQHGVADADQIAGRLRTALTERATRKS